MIIDEYKFKNKITKFTNIFFFLLMKFIVLFLNLFFTTRCDFNNNSTFKCISSLNNNQYGGYYI